MFHIQKNTCNSMMVEIGLNIYKKWDTVIHGFMYHQLTMPVCPLLIMYQLTNNMN